MNIRTLAQAILISALSAASMSCNGNGKAAAANDASKPLTAADMLRARLDSIAAAGKVAFGHHDDPVYGHTWCGDENRSDVLESSGDYPAVMDWDLGGLELNDTVNLDKVSFNRIRKEVVAQNARGGFNTFSWHTRNPVNLGTSWEAGDTTIVSKIMNDPEITQRYRDNVKALAAFFNSLVDESGNKIPVVFRPWHEHSGDWFWWGSRQCTPEQYKFLWHEMRKVMDAEGVDNVLWAYSPDRVRSVEQYMERYPGDEYVDILGSDVYHFNGQEGLEQYNTDAVRSLGIAADEAQKRNKILAFTETGSEGIPMESWWTDVLLPILGRYPVSYIVVWRNAHDNPRHYYVPFKGHPAEASFVEFRNNESTLFAKDMKQF